MSGLLNCLAHALKCIDVEDILDKNSVLGGGTDRVSVNIAPVDGMRGNLQNALPRLFW